MRRRPFALALTLAAALSTGAGALYAEDSPPRDRIAPGTSVGGVRLGFLTAAGARAKLRRTLVPRLQRPVTVVYQGRRFTLSPRAARVRVDVDGIVREALRRSRQAGGRSRAGGKRSPGGPVRISLRASYSEEALAAFVTRVKKRIDRPARDAEVRASEAGLTRIASHDGIEVPARKLRGALRLALLQPRRPRLIRAPAAPRPATVTTAELPSRYPYFITISRGEKQLRFFKGLALFETYEIAVGQIGHSTPSGLYRIENKAVDPPWRVPDEEWAGELAGKLVPAGSPDNPIKARWMGFYGGAGIHGTDDVASLGTAASHGCIRMAIPDVIELYEQVPLGTPVYIA
jgi:lipoprotein-anchoring transpeptidase ErfK/SrfK